MISCRLHCMLTTIDFNDEFGPAADEIDDVAANLNLAPKMSSVQWHTVTQVPPELTFSFGRCSAHFASKRALRRSFGAIPQCPDAWLVVMCRHQRILARPPPPTPPHKGEGRRDHSFKWLLSQLGAVLVRLQVHSSARQFALGGPFQRLDAGARVETSQNGCAANARSGTTNRSRPHQFDQHRLAAADLWLRSAHVAAPPPRSRATPRRRLKRARTRKI